MYQHGFQTILELENPVASFVKIRFFDAAHEDFVPCLVFLPMVSDGSFGHRASHVIGEEVCSHLDHRHL